MSAELVKLPNKDLKILRANIKNIPSFLEVPPLKDFNNICEKFSLKQEEIDILFILLHLYFKNKEKDGLLYINTDDILILRGVKKNKAGYKKEVRRRINNKIEKLSKTNIFSFIDYKDFNFIMDFNTDYFNTIETIPINQKLFTLNPITKSWHKSIGLYLEILKNNSASNNTSIQIKKLLKIISYTSSLKTLFPYQIRERFENTLDELNSIGIFKSWYYKNIDEEELNSKNWLFFWKLLSVKISFQ